MDRFSIYALILISVSNIAKIVSGNEVVEERILRSGLCTFRGSITIADAALNLSSGVFSGKDLSLSLFFSVPEINRIAGLFWKGDVDLSRWTIIF
jgi:hypothetical protein